MQLSDFKSIADGRGYPLTTSLENMVRCWKDDDLDGMVARYPSIKRQTHATGE
jgi:hypothetical protein